MFRKVFLGPLNKPENMKLADINTREIIILVPLLIMIFWIGLYPAPFLNLLNPTVNHLVEIVQSTALALR
jgi:NADH-quinone oxidoreductase subunit M